MLKAVHITDLHAGRHDVAAADELLLDIEAAGADIVLIGGDFTQRSRRSEWELAASWLERISAPWLATPGNHDIPLFDVGRRIASPFGRYAEAVSADLEPMIELDGMLFVASRSAAPERRAEGAVSGSSSGLLEQRLENSKAAGPRVLMTHHPLVRHPQARPGRPARGWEETLSVAQAGGVDLLLSGHTHRRHDGPFSVNVEGRSLIAAQSGTACSTRLRGMEPASWQVLELEPDRIRIEPRIWNPELGCFLTGPVSEWVGTAGSWEKDLAGA
ncbi:MAG: metallophosphoesterase [Solirubrobacterales bacterium]|nr:metallophosphoesterase [Solirubrobacterales bacterium]